MTTIEQASLKYYSHLHETALEAARIRRAACNRVPPRPALSPLVHAPPVLESDLLLVRVDLG